MVCHSKREIQGQVAMSGDGIIVGQEFAVGETAVEDAVETVRFLEIAFLGIGRLALIEADEVVDLAEEGTDAAHLPTSAIPSPANAPSPPLGMSRPDFSAR